MAAKKKIIRKFKPSATKTFVGKKTSFKNLKRDSSPQKQGETEESAQAAASESPQQIQAPPEQQVESHYLEPRQPEPAPAPEQQEEERQLPQQEYIVAEAPEQQQVPPQIPAPPQEAQESRPLVEAPAAHPGHQQIPEEQIEEIPEPRPVQAQPEEQALHEVPEQAQVPEEEVLEEVSSGGVVYPPNYDETDDFKDQILSCAEVINTISLPGWESTEVIDIIHMMVRSLNMDVVSLVIADQERPGSLKPVVSRGFSLPPNRDIVSLWEGTVTGECSVDWDKLMDLAADKKTELAYWVVHSEIMSVGYVPLQDGQKAYGFLFIGTIGKKEISPIASPLFEICGCSIGASLAMDGMLKNAAEQAAAADPQVSTKTGPIQGLHPGSKDVVLKILNDLQGNFSMLMGNLARLRSASGMEDGDISSVINECNRMLSKSILLLDDISDIACGKK